MTKSKKKLIQGAGGGKGGGGAGRVAQEAADNLQSKAFAQIIDLISEGEIGGLVDGLKSVYLDGTPIQSPSGIMNFKGVEIQTRVGTQDQDYITGVPATENEISVGVDVLNDTPAVRTISNETIDAIEVKISFPQMTEQNTSNGDLGGTEVNIAIDLQSNSTGYQEVVNDTIIGKCVSKYERSYRINLAGPGPWDIRVRRITDDSTSSAIQNKTTWSSYKEIIDGKLKYPNSALVALQIDSSQFSSIPTRGYDIKGIKIRVPSNYDPTTRVYTGIWDGTFQIAWSDNPAWIFYDLITSSRYGLGDFIPEANVDKWSLYAVGKYSDELIPDGFGGHEPRFTCNLYLQSREEAFQVLQDLASAFRGMVYWASGVITTTQDAPSDAAYLFTSANVVDGAFSYSGSSAKSRHTVALVSWNDPADLYRQKIEYVEDADGIARFGVVEAQVTGFGCSSRGQAHRLGKWLLFTEQNQTEVVTFKTGLNGSAVRPGQVIKIMDPMRAGTRRGGRISSSSTVDGVETLTLDQSYTLDLTSVHKISALLSDGTVEEKQITSNTGNQVVLDSPFSVSVENGAIYLITSSTLDAQIFRIIGIKENTDGTHEITAVAHDPSKYDAIELGLKLETRTISSLSVVPASPQNIQLTETLYAVNADVRVKLTISWDAVSGASGYVVQYAKDNNNIITMNETSSNDVEVLNVEPGVYNVSVFAINPVGTKSPAGTASKRVIGKALPPGDVQNFSLIPSNGQAVLSWDKSVDLDVLIGGSVRIRYTPETTLPAWKDSVDIAPGLAGSSTTASVPLLSGTYMAKFIDSSGIPSTDEAVIITTIPQALDLNVVTTLTESPGFAGAKTNMVLSSDLTGLVLDSTTTIDQITENMDLWDRLDFYGELYPSGTYDFATVVDLANPYTSRITASLGVESLDLANTVDRRLETIDSWSDFDGTAIEDVNAQIYVKTTLDDPNDVAAVWTDFKPFFVGEYLARGLKFQLQATSGSRNHNIVIQDLSVVVDMPDRTVNLPGLVSGAGTYTVTYANAFAATPAIGITANNMATGDYFVISSSSATGFQIVFKNASGAAVSRTFDVIAKGYGRKV